MNVSNPRDFFHMYISVMSSLVADDYRLTWKEIDFLSECCMYNYLGKDLTDMKALTQHMLDIEFFTRPADVNTYKCKIGTKKWASTGRNKFTLPSNLDFKEGEPLVYKLEIKLVDPKTGTVAQ